MAAPTISTLPMQNTDIGLPITIAQGLPLQTRSNSARLTGRALGAFPEALGEDCVTEGMATDRDGAGLFAWGKPGSPDGRHA